LTATTLAGAPGRLSSLTRNPASPWRHLDAILLSAVVAASAIGGLMIFSATRGTEPGDANLTFAVRQGVFVAMGLVVMVLVAAVDYRRIRELALVAYIGIVGLLGMVVSSLGSETKGTQAWFQLGSFQLQPSEIAKVVVIVTVAALIANWQGDIDLRRLIVVGVVVGVPMTLIMMQPDLGTTLVFVAIALGLLVVGGTPSRYLAVLVALGLTLTVGVFQSDLLAEYQRCRLQTFIDPEACGERDAGYNVEQSEIAVGAGGALGQGLFQGTQTRLDIVPEQHTDFIFTAVGEELGFAGAATLLTLFAIMSWRMWRTAQLARDQLGTLICVGVLAMFAFQVFQNVGMTMGIMPVTGIPLPFVSYGGSSTIAAFAAIGLVLNVHMRRFS
jgi:rod shape determining protein RodA